MPLLKHITIVIVRSGRALLPEVQAYSQYFEGHGAKVEVVEALEVREQCQFDVVLVFYGLFPKWRGRPKVLVADVNSLSGGHFRRARDWIKSTINHTPDIRIVLNEYVAASSIGIHAPIEIQRSMGYFPELIKSKGNAEFDFIYAGALNREGVRWAIQYLADLGFTVCVAGPTPNNKFTGNVHTVGRVSLPELYELYSKSVYGLNFVPDEPPFKFQDSTKLIEYCANQLRIVTTRYPWVNRFEADNSGRFLTWSKNLTRETIEGYDYQTANVVGLDWPSILKQARIAEAINEIRRTG